MPVGGQLRAQVGFALGRLAHPRGQLLAALARPDGVGAITTPSSPSVRLSAGIDPGIRPPTSA